MKKFKFPFTNKIDELLSKTDCTLEELLDEDEIIQEVKNYNKNLMT